MARCTWVALAVATMGAPVSLREMAPIQFQCVVPAIGSGVKVIAVSGGAGVKDGVARRRKCVKGWASSPGAGLMAARF